MSYSLRLIANEYEDGYLANRSSTYLNFDTAEAAPVPEPGTMLLLTTGMVGFAGIYKKKCRKE
jgi:hypothetical protein